jgi:hypothetical protein
VNPFDENPTCNPENTCGGFSAAVNHPSEITGRKEDLLLVSSIDAQEA